MPHTRWFLTIAVLMPLGGTGLADDAPVNGPRTLAQFPQGVEQCFIGRFAERTIAAHKGQILTEFALYRLFRPHPGKESVEQSPAELVAADRHPSATNWVEVLAKIRDGKGYYDQSLTCYDSQERDGIFCGVDCDGGSFALKPAAEGVVLSFDPQGGLSLNQSCEEPDEDGHSHWLTAAEAGGTVALARHPIADCVAADGEARPAFAADPVSLRERIERNGWRCLKRIYDEAHLKQHPQQKVAAIAIALKGPAKAEKDDDGLPTTSLAVTLSLRLTNGRTASSEVTCTADDYQFRCGEDFRLRRRDDATAMLMTGQYGGSEAPAAPGLAGLAVGADDRAFKLEAGSEENCSVD